jgi:hypothetical protein
MEMHSDLRQRIQIVLALALSLAAIRTGYILYGRYAAKAPGAQKAEPAAPPLDPDYYVVPKKLYPFDLKTARQLTQQPVWVKEGYRYPYYPYNSTLRRTDFEHDAGLLLPIQKLQIQDVVLDTAPRSGGQQQVMALFQQAGKTYAFQIGYRKDGDYKIYSDAMLYVQDPRDLYKHWPAEVWQAVEQHQVRSGMNELQVDFAIGMGTPDRQADPAWKTVHYPHGGSPITITFRDGKATEIKSGNNS